jgi:hypothetical protein
VEITGNSESLTIEIGQYHWVSELASPRYQKFLSYSTGWLITLGWQTFLAGVSFSVVSTTISWPLVFRTILTLRIGWINLGSCRTWISRLCDSCMAPDTPHHRYRRFLCVLQHLPCGSFAHHRSHRIGPSYCRCLRDHHTAVGHCSAW